MQDSVVMSAQSLIIDTYNRIYYGDKLVTISAPKTIRSYEMSIPATAFIRSKCICTDVLTASIVYLTLVFCGKMYIQRVSSTVGIKQLYNIMIGEYQLIGTW